MKNYLFEIRNRELLFCSWNKHTLIIVSLITICRKFWVEITRTTIISSKASHFYQFEIMILAVPLQVYPTPNTSFFLYII